MTAERYQKLTLSLTQGKSTNFPSTLQRKKRGYPHAENGFPKTGSAQRAARCPPTKITIQFRKSCLPFQNQSPLFAVAPNLRPTKRAQPYIRRRFPTPPGKKSPRVSFSDIAAVFLFFPFPQLPLPPFISNRANTFLKILSLILYHVVFFSSNFTQKDFTPMLSTFISAHKEYPRDRLPISYKDLQKYPMQATSYHEHNTKLFDWIHLTCLLFPIEKARSVLLLPITLFEFVEV